MANILTIDDSPEILEVTAHFLRLDGHNPLCFTDGASAVQAAVARPPDVVVCDINMSDLDGFGVLAALRGNQGTADVPFIFLSSHDDSDRYRKALKGGADDYITKPVSRKTLAAAIESCLERCQATALAKTASHQMATTSGSDTIATDALAVLTRQTHDHLQGAAA